VTGPLASSPRRPTVACPGPVLQYRPTKPNARAAASSPRSPCAATPPRHLHASAMQHRLHVRHTPSSPTLIHCELHTEGLSFSLHPFRAASSLCSPRTRAQPPLTESYRCATPSSCAMSTPSTFQPQADPLVVEVGTLKRYHRSRATAAESLHDVSLHRSSSGHTCSTPSTARAPDTFPPQHSIANDRRSSPPRQSPPADRPPPSSNHHGEPPAALRLKSKPPSLGATPRLFPRRPTTADRSNFTDEPPTSRGGGDFPPLFPQLGQIAE
jgi:hypothetical protein